MLRRFDWPDLVPRNQLVKLGAADPEGATELVNAEGELVRRWLGLRRARHIVLQQRMEDGIIEQWTRV